MKSTDENPLAFFEYIINEINIKKELEEQLKHNDFLSYNINLPHVINYIEHDEWNQQVDRELEIQKILTPVLRREFEKAKKHLHSAFLNNEPSLNFNYLILHFNTIQSLISNHLNIIKRYPYCRLP